MNGSQISKKRRYAMKKSLGCWLVLGLIGMALPASAGTVPKSNLTAQVTGSWLDLARVEYETALDNQTSLAVRAEFLGKTIDDMYTRGFGGGVAYRFYPMTEQPAPVGMFVGPAFDAMNVTASNAGETASSIFYDLQVEFGYRFLFGEGIAFVLVPQVYLGYTFGQLSVGGKDLDLDGMAYGAGLGLGLAW
jgi:hypothetical protein